MTSLHRLVLSLVYPLLCLSAGAGEKFVVAADCEEVRGAVTDSLKASGYVAVASGTSLKELAGRPVADLLTDEGLFQSTAKKVFENSGANILVVAIEEAGQGSQNTDLGTVQWKSTVTIAALYTQTGVVLCRVSEKGSGSSSSEAKAAEKARAQAVTKAMPSFQEKLKEGLAGSAVKSRKMVVKVTDLPETLYDSAGLKMRRTLEKIAGASEIQPKYDAEAKELSVTFFFEGNIVKLEDKLRADSKFMRDFILTKSDAEGMTFRLNASRMMLVLVGHDPAKIKEAGTKLHEVLKANPDAVDETASFAESSFEIRFLASSPAMEIHEAIQESLKDDAIGKKLRLNTLAPDGILYRFGGDLLKVRVTGLGPDSYDQTGIALSNVVGRVTGVDAVTRDYSAAEKVLTLNVFYAGDRTSLENALRKSHKGLGELALADSTGDTLTFAFALRALTFRIRGVQPEVVQREGGTFAAAARAIAGTRGLAWAWETDGDFTVGFMWKGTASEFHSRVEKNLKGFQLIRAKDAEAEYAVGGRAITVTVTGLEDGFYENTSATLTERLQGLDGTTGIRRFYDASAKTLGFVVFYDGDARKLEDALKGNQKGLGELAVSSQAEDKLVLAFALREIGIGIEAEDVEGLKDFGAALGLGLKGAEGIAEPTWTFDEKARRFDIRLLSRGGATDVHAAVLKAAGAHRLASQLHLVVAHESALGYRLGEMTIAGTVEVTLLTADAMGRIADGLMDALKGVAGVREAVKSYAEAEKTLRVTLKFAGTAAELDEALWSVVKGNTALEELSPSDAGGGRVAYVWRSGEQAVTISVSNVIPSAVDASAKAVKDALGLLEGVKIETQAYQEKTTELTIDLKTKRRSHELDEAIRATPGLLTLLESTPATLRYEAAPSMDQVTLMELREVDQDRMKTAGTEFLAMLKGIAGVADVRNEYAGDRKAMLITVTFRGKPVDLDSAIWASVAGKEAFAALYPGDLSLGILVYEFRSQPQSTPATITVHQVKPTAYQEVRSVFEKAVSGIEGVKDSSESYDDATETFALSLTLEKRPSDVFSILMKNLAGLPEAARFSLQRSVGTECVYRHAPGSTAKPEFSVQVSGWREKEDAALGEALVKTLAAVAGLEGVAGSYRPDLFSFVVTFVTKLESAAIDDAVRRALGADASLARVRPGGLRDGLLVCGLAPLPGGGGDTPPPPPATNDRPTLTSLVEKVDPGVVFISVQLKTNKEQAWLGSGFLVSSQGHIVTNDHVVSIAGPDGKKYDPKDLKIRAKLADGRWFAATILLTDPELDAAVIRIKATDLPALDMGDSDTLKIGQDLFVIGNPLGLEHSVTTGIVSAFNRLGGRIQTNALINHGNSGGPAFAMDGSVVAIAVSGAVTNYAYDGERVEVPMPGINFLIPINQIRPLIEKAGK